MPSCLTFPRCSPPSVRATSLAPSLAPSRAPFRAPRCALACALLAASLTSHAAEPSTASIETLFSLNQTEEMVTHLSHHQAQSLRHGLIQAFADRGLSEAQSRALDLAAMQFEAELRQALSWGKLKPIYLEIYRTSFSQEEINGLTAFYRSPTGAAYLRKTPAVAQKTTAAVAAQMQPVLERLRAALHRRVSLADQAP